MTEILNNISFCIDLQGTVLVGHCAILISTSYLVPVAWKHYQSSVHLIVHLSNCNRPQTAMESGFKGH